MNPTPDRFAFVASLLSLSGVFFLVSCFTFCDRGAHFAQQPHPTLPPRLPLFFLPLLTPSAATNSAAEPLSSLFLPLRPFFFLLRPPRPAAQQPITLAYHTHAQRCAPQTERSRDDGNRFFLSRCVDRFGQHTQMSNKNSNKLLSVQKSNLQPAQLAKRAQDLEQADFEVPVLANCLRCPSSAASEKDCTLAELDRSLVKSERVFELCMHRDATVYTVESIGGGFA